MRGFALRIIALWGWRRALAAVVAGALLALSMAPFDFLPVIFISLPILVWLLDGVGGRGMSWATTLVQAFFIGFLFAFGYFLAGLYWVGYAFFVEAEIYAWMMPLAVTGLAAGLGLFGGVTTVVARIFWSPGPGRVFALAGAWAGVEWLRGHLLTGFPWNSLGYSLAAFEATAQGAAFVGLYGLSFVAVLIGALPALGIGNGAGLSGNTKARYLAPGVAVLALAALWGAGQFRLSATQTSNVEGVRLRIVQANIKQSEKWAPEKRSTIFARYLELSNKATSPDTMGVENITHLIWPETALPFLLSRRPDAMAAIAALLPDKVTLLTGALRREAPKPEAAGRRSRVFNSILQISGDGRMVGAYDKFHLVPFGEYLPAEETLKKVGFRRLVTVPLSMSAGAGPVTMPVRNAPPVSPLICYEIIFPGAVVAREDRPQWILNVTNDAWFGDSPGPRQHLRQAVLRAVEEGLPVVRAANTGISAVIDPLGRLRHALAVNTAGVIDARLPKPLAPTFFARYRDWPLALLLALAGVLAVSFKARGARARLGRRLAADQAPPD